MQSAERRLHEQHSRNITMFTFNFLFVQVRTLGSDEDESVSLFQRRLGVLVGALVGLIVFTILITTLACVKIRKRRLLRQQVGFLYFAI